MTGKKSRRAFWSKRLKTAIITTIKADGGNHPVSMSSEEKHKLTTAAVEVLLQKHGEAHRPRIERGVRQQLALWRSIDGDPVAFAKQHFVADAMELERLFARLEHLIEQLEGHFLEIARELRWHSDLDTGALLSLEPLLARFDVSAHLNEDLFRSKIAFVVLLNFPAAELPARQAMAAHMSRRDWAILALTQRFDSRVPSRIQQEISQTQADADLYISEYNIWMHHVLNDAGERLFPQGMRLISHWNLRDQIKADYAEQDGLERQRLIRYLLERIVEQSIPEAVINNPAVDWQPLANRVTKAPKRTVEESAKSRSVTDLMRLEPDCRYVKILDSFRAQRKADRFTPLTPTVIRRKFEKQRGMTQARAEQLLLEVVSSSLAKQVGQAIKRRLGRDLEAHDIWYDGFKRRSELGEQNLSALTRARYPDTAAFARDMPRLLRTLGFSPKRAHRIAGMIRVDRSRGAGHALGAQRRGDMPRLRTRLGNGGMDYKGYNIAVHELGHNVEQVLSLYEVDSTLLRGVPAPAFSEAIAFLFQARDLQLLGVQEADNALSPEAVLDAFWSTYEIAGMALVELKVWEWLYVHPDANAAALRQAALEQARALWECYYAPVLGSEGGALLAVYSHMIAYPLYLIEYPLGHLIAFQLERELDQQGSVGALLEKAVPLGAVLPDTWMQHATGAALGSKALLDATAVALGQLGSAKKRRTRNSASSRV
jgi:hypothetical protein